MHRWGLALLGTLGTILAADPTAPADGGCCGGKLLAVATCTGSASCRACKDCSHCAHCTGGGSCGVCAGGSGPRTTSRAPSGSTTESDPIRARDERIRARIEALNAPLLKQKEIEAAIAREKIRARKAEIEWSIADDERLRPARERLAAARRAGTIDGQVRMALAEGRELERLGIRDGAIAAYQAVLERTTRGYDAATAAARLMVLKPRADVPAVVVGPFAPPPTATEIRALALAAGEEPDAVAAGLRAKREARARMPQRRAPRGRRR